MAVAIRASEIPGPTVARLVAPDAPIFRNAFMIPHTVPNRPMNGATLAMVARKVTRFSSLPSSTVDARRSARSTAGRLFRVGRPAGPAGLAGGGAPGRGDCAFGSAYPPLETPPQGA